MSYKKLLNLSWLWSERTRSRNVQWYLSWLRIFKRSEVSWAMVVLYNVVTQLPCFLLRKLNTRVIIHVSRSPDNGNVPPSTFPHLRCILQFLACQSHFEDDGSNISASYPYLYIVLSLHMLVHSFSYRCLTIKSQVYHKYNYFNSVSISIRMQGYIFMLTEFL